MDTVPEFQEARPFSSLWAEGRLLVMLSLMSQIDADPRWIEIGRRKVDRLLELSVAKEGFRFFWEDYFKPGDRTPEGVEEPMDGLQGGGFGVGKPIFAVVQWAAAVSHGAGLFYRTTGYEPALELAGGVARWALARMFARPDGRYKADHFHIMTYLLMGLCQYGDIIGDSEILERVDACYRWTKTVGDSLIGFFPEAMPGSHWSLGRRGNTLEMCEVADMIALVLFLTRAGMGDYWDDVDAWTRNIFSEGQLQEHHSLEGLPDAYFQEDAPHGPYAY